MRFFCCRCCRPFQSFSLSDNSDTNGIICPMCQSPFTHVVEEESNITINDYVGDERTFQNVLQRLFESSTTNKVRGLSINEIDDLPRIIIDSSNTINTDCPICQENFKFGEEVISLEKICTHHFHASCLILWLTKVGSCPVCRKEIL